jgi:asparagine synthase (glutamine-hydrolysing)
MCGIAGAFNCANGQDMLLKGMERIKHRGCGYSVSDGKGISYAGSTSELRKLRLNGGSLLLKAVQHEHGKGILMMGESALALSGTVYNRRELCRKHGFRAGSDEEALLSLAGKAGNAAELSELLADVRGPYAFACLRKGRVILARDVTGLRPLWTAHEGRKFAFATERKILLAMGFAPEKARELHPRHIMEFDAVKGGVSDFYRGFLDYGEESKLPFKEAKESLGEALRETVKAMLPEGKFGILFSGGVDSTLLAKLAAEAGGDFVCYTAAASEKAKDLVHAKEAAENVGLELRHRVIKQEDTERFLSEAVRAVEDASQVKADVSLPLHVACGLAGEDGMRVVFSGSGSDELFCGYERHRHGSDLRKEAHYEMLRFFEATGSRDYTIAAENGLEMKHPYMDRKVAELAMRLPGSFRAGERNGMRADKYILRETALDAGIPEEIAFRKKIAVQYGSGFGKAVSKEAASRGMEKSAYLKRLLGHENGCLGALVSTGKDSIFATGIMAKQNYRISCLITIKSSEPDSYMFHTPLIGMVRMQAEATGIPLVERETKGEKEKELEDLGKAVKEAVERHGIEGIVSGAIHSNYQRMRLEKIADKAGIKSFSPLWHTNEEGMLKAMLKEGFRVMVIKTAAAGMEGFAGKVITDRLISELMKVREKHGISIAGEGGEFETLVLDAPLFRKRISCEGYEVRGRGSVKEVSLKGCRLEEKLIHNSGDRKKAPPRLQ